jgi:hypothetical protein
VVDTGVTKENVVVVGAEVVHPVTPSVENICGAIAAAIPDGDVLAHTE